MFLNAIGTALPEKCYSKDACWVAFKASDWFGRLDARSHAIAKLVLTRNNGIEERWLSVASLDEVFAIDPDVLHRRFVAHAPRLASAAGQSGLRTAGVSADQIDAVIVTTCTGYLCPALSGYVIERLGLRSDILAFDLVGQGCAGALPNWQLASALLTAGHCDHVLSISVEICSAAMYLDDDPGVLISACLFGDGAGAAVLSRNAPNAGRRIKWTTSVSVTAPAERDSLRFEHRNGLLRNILTREVPRLAAEHADEAFQLAIARAGLTQGSITGWMMHAGGRDVLLAMQEQL